MLSQPSIRNFASINAALVVFLALSCASGDTGPTTPGNSNNNIVKVGQVVFWTDQPIFLPITVKIGGTLLGDITAAMPLAPDCGAAGAVTLTRSVGSASYVGTTPAQAATWDGSVTVEDASCIAFRLYNETPPPPKTTGRISVWKNGPTAGGTTVKINGVAAGTLTSYFDSGTPACGAAGTVTVAAGAGTSTLLAVWQEGNLRWTATPTITANGCTLFGLTVPAPATGGGGTGGDTGGLRGADSPDLIWISASWGGGATGSPLNSKARTSSSMKGAYCPANSIILQNKIGSDGRPVFSVKSTCTVTLYICATSGSGATQPQYGLPVCAQDPFDTPENRLTGGQTLANDPGAAMWPSTLGLSVEVWYCSSVTRYQLPANFLKGACR